MKKMLFTLVMGLVVVASSAFANTSVITSAPATNTASAQQKAGTPSAVAVKFCNNMMKGVVEKDSWYIKEVFDELEKMNAEQKKLFNEYFMQAVNEMGKELAKQFEEFKGAKFVVVSESISENGRTATVKLKISYNGETEYVEIPMVKYAGKWRVDLEELSDM